MIRQALGSSSMQGDIQIRLIDIVGSGFCVDADDAQKVHDLIADAFNAGKSVTLSFDGVISVITAFLNTAIGQLYGEFSEEIIKAKLTVADIEPADLVKIRQAVDRAKSYFRDPQRMESIKRDVLGDTGDE
jgi:hypothetical protein